MGAAVEGPTHWAPSTHGFLDFTLAGVCWSLTPERLAAPHIASGRMVDLSEGMAVEVPLFWQHLTKAIRAEAADWLAMRDLTSAG